MTTTLRDLNLKGRAARHREAGDQLEHLRRLTPIPATEVAFEHQREG